MTYQKIAEKYDAWLMSNAKWRKVLSALSIVCNKEISVDIKTIDAIQPFSVRPPRVSDINETGFSDGAYQPFEYKWIEWIFVPAKQRVKEGIDLFREQDIIKVYNIFNEIVKIVNDIDNTGLKIYGYKKVRVG